MRIHKLMCIIGLSCAIGMYIRKQLHILWYTTEKRSIYTPKKNRHKKKIYAPQSTKDTLHFFAQADALFNVQTKKPSKAISLTAAGLLSRKLLRNQHTTS